ncbi:MAG: FHA domain-containing protein [Deltaproteobacteria bacterium]|nr:FHA domain-containing protein [Deltaproteobacteria bacterium]
MALQADGRSIELRRPLIIGRKPDCDVRLDDHRIGDRHAEIYQVGDLWWIRDLGSDDGVYVNGEIVEAALLDPTAEIRLGANGPTLLLCSP